jgi:ATPase subunit of ABC transporter with duplicated ATPase domains
MRCCPSRFFSKKKFMLTLHQISYIHPNRDLLFENINFTVQAHDKVALVGNNGVGKSSLLQIITGQVRPSGGQVLTGVMPCYVPQHVGQFDHLTVAQALRIEQKLDALKAMAEERATEAHLAVVNDDWLLEARCAEALAQWQLTDMDLSRSMATLSGGQKTKIFLAGIGIHQPELVLLDEPSNHLDAPARDQLYDYIRTTGHTLLVVSHDRTLLNLLNTVMVLGKKGISVYGGNYDFYAAQKDREADARDHDLKNKEKALRKARAVERESMERKQKLDARGKKKQEKAGLPTISMKTFRNNAEKSTSRLKDAHGEKISAIARELGDLRQALPDMDKIKIDLHHATLHTGKKWIGATAINYGYQDRLLWKQPLSFTIHSGDRVVIRGANGSGKTTLIRLLLGDYTPHDGTLFRAPLKAVYIDQDYSLIDNRLTVYAQAQRFNDHQLPEHEVKIRLNRFLFTREHWDKPCTALSGGEKMRLMLCCLTISEQAPEVIILDEPTNNLDIQNTEILTRTIHDYKGTLVVVSHDRHFLEEINTTGEIIL